MPISPELLELRGRLEEAGMVVVEEPTHLTVRLPYFCSVRVFSDNGRLRFESYLGLQPRTRATVLKLGIFGIGALASVRAGAPYALGVVVGMIIAGFYDVFRVMITENVITRAGLIHLQMRHASPSATPLPGGPPRTHELSAGSGGFPPAGELPPPSASTIIKRT